MRSLTGRIAVGQQVAPGGMIPKIVVRVDDGQVGIGRGLVAPTEPIGTHRKVVSLTQRTASVLNARMHRAAIRQRGEGRSEQQLTRYNPGNGFAAARLTTYGVQTMRFESWRPVQFRATRPSSQATATGKTFPS